MSEQAETAGVGCECVGSPTPACLTRIGAAEHARRVAEKQRDDAVQQLVQAKALLRKRTGVWSRLWEAATAWAGFAAFGAVVVLTVAGWVRLWGVVM